MMELELKARVPVMKRTIWLLPAALLIGCSTSPCADFLDSFWPAKPPASSAGAFGGVCNPAPTGPGVSGGSPIAPGSPPALAPMNAPPGTGPVVVPPGGTVPNPNAPYIPGGASPPPGTPPPMGNLPAPDLNGIPTSSNPLPVGPASNPLPAPPSGTAPPY